MNKKYRSRIVAAALAIQLMLGSLTACQAGIKSHEQEIFSQALPSVTVEPLETKGSFISRSSGFRLKVDEKFDLPAEELKPYLQVFPKREFTLERDGDSYVLTPDRPFQSQSIVNVALVNSKGQSQKTWAFQVEDGFSMLGSSPVNPEDGSEYDDIMNIPVNSGIEMYFSDPDLTPEMVEEHFSIYPKVEGDFRKDFDAITFIPREPFVEDTAYRITIDKGLCSTDGTSLGQDETINFIACAAPGDRQIFTHTSPSVETFLPGDTPVLAVSTSQELNQETFHIELFQFKTEADYRAALEKNTKRPESIWWRSPTYDVDTSKLIPVSTFDRNLVIPTEYSYTKYLVLPDNMEPGWYYARASVPSAVPGKPLTLDKLIQITPLSVYHMQVGDEVLFWANDTETGESAANAEVSVTLDGKTICQGKTDAQGVLKGDTSLSKDGAGKGILEIRSGDQVFYDFFAPEKEKELSVKEKYYTYLYTDRTIYRSSDTIQAWGVVLPRNDSVPMPKSVQVCLDSTGQELYTVNADVSGDGTFTAKIDFQNVSGKDTLNESISFMVGDETAATTYVTIGDFKKPAYVPSSTSDKVAYWAGEQGHAEFSLQFFDGTPAADVPLDLRTFGGEDSPVVTDAEGKVPVAFTVPQDVNDTSWRLNGEYFEIHNRGSENTSLWKYHEIYVANRDMALRGEPTEDGEKLKIQTNRITLDNIKEWGDGYKVENYLGAPVDASVEVELIKRTFTKVEVGTYYDYVHKVNQKKYRYDSTESTYSVEQIKTVNGEYLLDVPEPADNEEWRYILRSKDGKGRLVEENGIFYYMQKGLPTRHSYYFQQEDGAKLYRHDFLEDQPLKLELVDNDTPVTSGKMLSAVVQHDIRSWECKTESTVTIDFEESLLPNYTVAGAYFNGREVFCIQDFSTYFETASRKLNLSIETDQPSYGPGDEAEVKVTVTRDADNKPVSNANVLVSVVDEAVFAVSEQWVRFLDNLYTSAYWTPIVSTASYIEHDFAQDNMGEKGGGGGVDDIREDFKDTAAFQEVKTDENGAAIVKVKAPDNITSWRVTALALSPKKQAGDDKSKLIVTKDFFINPIYSENLLSGDTMSVSLRSAGQSSAETVEYEVLLEGAGEPVTWKGSGLGHQYLNADLGKVESGDYTLTITGKSQSGSDSIRVPITVSDTSRETLTSAEWAKDTTNQDIDVTRYPVVIRFQNSGSQLYQQVLKHLNQANGYRTDERIARQFVRDQVNCDWPDRDDLSDVLSIYGTAKLFPYSEEDAMLAAKIYLAVPEYKIGLHDSRFAWFYSGRDETFNKDELAKSCFTSAVNKGPVLHNIKRLIESNDQLTLESKLYLAAGLAALGDEDGARSYFDEAIRPNLKSDTNSLGQTRMFLEEQEGSQDLTALASITSSILRDETAEPLVRSLMERPAEKNIYLLEEIIFLKHCVPVSDANGKAEYQIDDKKETIELSGADPVEIVLNQDQWQSFSMRFMDEGVTATAWYMSAKGNTRMGDATLPVENWIVPPADGMKQGSVVTMVVQPRLPRDIDPNGTEVIMTLPAGMRYVDIQNSQESHWNLIKEENNRLTFRYYKYLEREEPEVAQEGIYDANKKPTYPEIEPLSLNVRNTLTGEYRWEGSYARTAGETFIEGFAVDQQVLIDE